MVKVRLSGTKKELRSFLKKVNRSGHYSVETTSDFMPYKDKKRFRILYANLRTK